MPVRGIGRHHTTHENDGVDEIDVTGLSGKLADPQTPEAHSSSHQPGGSDSISPLTGDLDFGSHSAVNVKNINGTDGINFDNSNVGIGTTEPRAKLDIRQSGTHAKALDLISTEAQATNNSVDIRFFTPSAGVTDPAGTEGNYKAKISAITVNYGNLEGALAFYTNYPHGTLSERMRIAPNGNVGIGLEYPGYKLDVSGDIHCTGKLTSDGGNDPAYVLYDYQTRKSIIELVKREVPPGKLSGAVLFFNGERQSLELFLPLKGEFRSLNGELLEKIDPITETFEVEKRYYFNEETGEVKSYEVKKNPRKYRLKAGVTLDPETGKFKKAVKRKVKKIIDGKEKIVEVEEEIEITEKEAIEEVKEIINA